MSLSIQAPSGSSANLTNLEQYTDTVEPLLLSLANRTGDVELSVDSLLPVLTAQDLKLQAMSVILARSYNNQSIHQIVDANSGTYNGHSVCVAVLAGAATISINGNVLTEIPAGTSLSWEAITVLDHGILVIGQSVGTRIVVTVMQ